MVKPTILSLRGKFRGADSTKKAPVLNIRLDLSDSSSLGYWLVSLNKSLNNFSV